jgi:hypothetical protein
VTPTSFDRLRVCGFLDALPDEGLPRPVVRSAVLLHAESETVLVPPFEIEDERLLDARDEMDRATFEALCERGEATSWELEPARSDGCFYAEVGLADLEYTSLSTAAARLSKYAKEQAAAGDEAFRRGDRRAALRAYENAAATVQSPEHYARLYSALPEGRRRDRIRKWLEAVAEAEGPEVHLRRARDAMGSVGSIFGNSARRTTEPLPVPA